MAYFIQISPLQPTGNACDFCDKVGWSAAGLRKSICLTSMPKTFLLIVTYAARFAKVILACWTYIYVPANTFRRFSSVRNNNIYIYIERERESEKERQREVCFVIVMWLRNLQNNLPNLLILQTLHCNYTLIVFYSRESSF